MQPARWLMAVWIALALMGSNSSAQTGTPAVQPNSVVFVCERGSAKSLIAATLFNRIAAERSLPIRAIARGLAPDGKVPETVVRALGAEGFDVASFEPARASDVELSAATRVVGMGIHPAALGSKRADIEIWSDMPSSADYRAFRGVLLDRIEGLLLIVAPASQQEAHR